MIATAGYRDYVEAQAEPLARRLVERERFAPADAALRSRLLVMELHGFYQRWLLWGCPGPGAAGDALLDLQAEIFFTTLHDDHDRTGRPPMKLIGPASPAPRRRPRWWRWRCSASAAATTCAT